jgi:uroporphyrinogen decarboxylase
VQLFDSWAGLFDRSTFASLVAPAAARAVEGLDVPSIYFAPGAAHTLDLQPAIGADGYGVDWRMPIDEAWARLGDVAVQGNLDPAVLLADPATIEAAVEDLLARTAARPGHIVNLGHGIDHRTDPEHLAVMVKRVLA